MEHCQWALIYQTLYLLGTATASSQKHIVYSDDHFNTIEEQSRRLSWQNCSNSWTPSSVIYWIDNNHTHWMNNQNMHVWSNFLDARSYHILCGKKKLILCTTSETIRTFQWLVNVRLKCLHEHSLAEDLQYICTESPLSIPLKSFDGIWESGWKVCMRFG